MQFLLAFSCACFSPNLSVGIEGCCDSIELQSNRLRWYGHVLKKEDSEWVKKCIDFVAEGVRPRGDQREHGKK